MVIVLMYVFASLPVSTSVKPVPNEFDDKIVIFAVGVRDFRKIPMNKQLIKKLYEININIRNSVYVSGFSTFLKKYQGAKDCEKCLDKFQDSRIYIQIFKKGKLELEAEVCDGGECIKIGSKNYCLDNEFYDHLLAYFPLIDRDKYAPLRH